MCGDVASGILFYGRFRASACEAQFIALSLRPDDDFVNVDELLCARWTAGKDLNSQLKGDRAALNVEAKMHDVAVANDIIGAFEAHAAGILGALLAAISDKVVV